MTAKYGVGDVQIELGGEEVILKPSLHATLQLSRQQGGIVGAINKVGQLDMDTFVAAISLGLNLKNTRDQRDLAEKVYKTGMVDLVAPVTKYLTILANGGKPPRESEDADEGDEREENPS